MANINVITESTIAHSKAFVFALEHYLLLVKAGHADNELVYNNSAPVTYAVENNIVIGVSVWDFNPAKRAAWILFSAVAVEHRRKGVYTAIFKEVEKNVKRKGAVALYSSVHVTNNKMIEAARTNGRELGWYRTKKTL